MWTERLHHSYYQHNLVRKSKKMSNTSIVTDFSTYFKKEKSWSSGNSPSLLTHALSLLEESHDTRDIQLHNYREHSSVVRVKKGHLRSHRMPTIYEEIELYEASKPIPIPGNGKKHPYYTRRW